MIGEEEVSKDDAKNPKFSDVEEEKEKDDGNSEENNSSEEEKDEVISCIF